MTKQNDTVAQAADNAANTATQQTTKRDPRTGRLVMYLPHAAPAQRSAKPDSKTGQVFTLLDGKDGATVQDISTLLASLAPNGNAPSDLAYAKTWVAPSYVRLYGYGVCSNADDSGTLRFWLVRKSPTSKRGWTTNAPKAVQAALLDACGTLVYPDASD